MAYMFYAAGPSEAGTADEMGEAIHEKLNRLVITAASPEGLVQEFKTEGIVLDRVRMLKVTVEEMEG